MGVIFRLQKCVPNMEHFAQLNTKNICSWCGHRPIVTSSVFKVDTVVRFQKLACAKVGQLIFNKGICLQVLMCAFFKCTR